VLKPEYTNKFLKDLALMQKRDHKLTGDFSGNRECHIDPDWLLVYYYGDGVIVFARTGTHADIFR
jgi:mRNA interferase YafQ